MTESVHGIARSPKQSERLRRNDLDAHRLAIWGDSLAPTNPRMLTLAVPLEVDLFASMSEFEIDSAVAAAMIHRLKET